MRPIDGDALEKDLRESHDQLREIYNGLKHDDDRRICAGQLTTFTEAILRIKDAPTIDPYGKWIYDEYGNPHCSRCEHVQDAPTNYCSECGTDMRGNQNE